MATPTGTFRPAQALMTGSATALQLRMYLGELIGIYQRGLQIVPHLRTKTIDAGISWQCPAYGLAEAGKYHVAGEDVMIDSGYLQQVPMADKTFFIDLPFVINALIPSFDEFQTHYPTREIVYRQLAERQARQTDLKACWKLAIAAETGANVTGGLVPAGSVTPAGFTITNAAMLTSATVLLDAIKQAAQRLDENDVPAAGRKCALHPAQYWNLVNDRQLLDSDVLRMPGANGDFAMGTVYQAFGIQLISSTALKAMRTGGDHGAPIAGENAGYQEISAGTHAANAGIVFTDESVIRLVRKEMEMNTWYQDSRFANVVTTRVIDGYGVYRPECTVAFRTS